MAEHIKFSNGIVIDADLVINGNLIVIFADSIPTDTNIIEILADNKKTVLGTYIGYNTVYSRLLDRIVLSNDGSVLQPDPIIPDDPIEPEEPENPGFEPSLDDRVTDLEAAVCELAEFIG